MPGMSDRPQPPHVRAWQEVLNCHWPADPRAIPRRDVDAKPVRARIVFADDGEQWLEGRMLRWDETHIWVELDDQRVSTNGVWLKPADVYRMRDVSMMPEK